jgi:glycolate oxidase iron-sulfur subunit
VVLREVRVAFDVDRALIDECVHCGFCLPTCPTYVVTGDEAESPRGRIYLMDLATRGEAPVAGPVVQHLDSCLGCLACVPACPSGVKYNALIESARPQLDREVPRDRFFRAAVFALFPYPRRLRVAVLFGLLYRWLGIRWLTRRSGLLGRLPARTRALEGLLPPVRARDLFSRTAAAGPADPRRTVALLTGCAQRVFFKPVNDATARVLAAEEARAFARRTIDAFEGYDTVVVNVAGCGSVLKEYGELLWDDPKYAERAAAFAERVRDVSEVLAELEPVAERHPLPLRVAYHDACHLANAQRITREPRDALRTIPGVELVDVPEEKICCGSAGVYNLLQADMAERLGRRKAENLTSARPDVIATGNAGCLLQIRRYAEDGPLIMHPVELLDRSIRGTAS